MSQRPMTRAQDFLLPPSLDDWTPPDHPVRFVAQVLESLSEDDWRAMTIDPVSAWSGAPRYAPELLTSVWGYGFMSGVRSARALEQACRDRIPFRWLTGNQCPDHNTLWRFYQAHRTGMQALLKRSIRVAVAADLVDLALMAVDGTKLRANAAVERSLDAEGLRKLLARAEQAIMEREAQNQRDDDPPPPSLPQELRTAKELRVRVQQALQQSLAAERGTGKVNLTDPEAVMMKGRQGIAPAYNGQAAVVATNAAAQAILGAAAPAGRIIVAATVIAGQPDAGELVPMISAAVGLLGQAPSMTVADAGYHSGETLAAAETTGYPVVMPESSQIEAPYHREAFRYEAAQDTVTCPQGQALTFRGMMTTATGQPPKRRYQGNPAVCRACPAFGVCPTNARHGRQVNLSLHDGLLHRHRVFREHPAQQAAIKRRRELVEPVFGIIKAVLATRRRLLRGKEQVEAEWTLLATAVNLRTLHRVWRALDPAAQTQMLASGSPGEPRPRCIGPPRQPPAGADREFPHIGHQPEDAGVGFPAAARPSRHAPFLRPIQMNDLRQALKSRA